MAGSVSSLMAAITTSRPRASAASRTSMGNRPLPAITPIGCGIVVKADHHGFVLVTVHGRRCTVYALFNYATLTLRNEPHQHLHVLTHLAFRLQLLDRLG